MIYILKYCASSASLKFEAVSDGGVSHGTQLRGLGTDVAILSSMVSLAQFILSMRMGYIVCIIGTTKTIFSFAAIIGLCGAISATQVMYLDL